MTRATTNASRLLALLKIEELAEHYSKMGYNVRRDAQVGGARVDLVAERGDEKIAIEVKPPGSLKSEAEALVHIRKAVQKAGYRFLLHVAVPPQDKQIEIAGLETALATYLVDNIPSNLDELSSRTEVDGVADVELDSIRVSTADIDIEGAGVVEVTLNYGGSSDEDGFSDSFPFHFKAVLNRDLKIVTASVNVDTSDFYGPD